MDLKSPKPKPNAAASREQATEQAEPRRDTAPHLASRDSRVFLEGYGGARVDAICKRAREPAHDLPLLRRQGRLYVSVLEHVLGELRAEEFKLEVDHVAPLEAL